MVTSAYIHFPFCKSKCKYCSFVSFDKLDSITEYVYALMSEITETYRGENLKTLYFGGGTPSLIPIYLLKQIASLFNFQDKYEFTIEVNPDDASLEYFKGLRNIGINRISMGVQTFDDKILKVIGRRHNSNDIVKAVQYAKQADFENISVDFIYGLPEQNLESVRRDLKKFLSLDIQHVSTYGLKIDTNSAWGNFFDESTNIINYPNGKVYSVPDDDMQADMYEEVNDILENNGYFRYEVSNFSKLGFESQHNLTYWNNAEYYGFGTAASGYVDGIRYTNYSSFEKYIIEQCKRDTVKILSELEKLQEEIFLGFRKKDGICIKSINEKFNIDFEKKYNNILKKYSDFFIKTDQGYTLSLKGVLVSNVILAEFI